MGIIPFEQIEAMYIELLGNNWFQLEPRYKKVLSEQSKISYLRSLAINSLIQEASLIFLNNEKEILSGSFDKPLIDEVPMIDTLNEIIKISINKCYRHRNVLEIEAAGFEVMSGLLDEFIPAILDSGSLKSKKILQLYPVQFLNRAGLTYENPYLNMINAVMFISSMTDKYALKLFRKIKGIYIEG